MYSILRLKKQNVSFQEFYLHLEHKIYLLKILRFYLFALISILFSVLQAQEKDSQYPDMVIEAHYSGYFDVLDSLYGGQGLDYPILMDVNKILGKNKEKWFVSLPKESYIILKFTDNEIVDAPNQNDLVIVEHGCCHELASVYISHDGKEFTFLGVVDDCDNNQLDLADVGYQASVRYVKVVGMDVKCASPGFDLVSVLPLGDAHRELYASMDEVDTFFENKTEKRSLILENVYFDTNSYEILPESEEDLQIVLQKLQDYPNIQIHVTGHTDAIASETYNMTLSLNRAKSVKAYLIANGIAESRILMDGKGESEPLRTNETEQGRAINRRVELRRLN